MFKVGVQNVNLKGKLGNSQPMVFHLFRYIKADKDRMLSGSLSTFSECCQGHCQHFLHFCQCHCQHFCNVVRVIVNIFTMLSGSLSEFSQWCQGHCQHFCIFVRVIVSIFRMLSLSKFSQCCQGHCQYFGLSSVHACHYSGTISLVHYFLGANFVINKSFLLTAHIHA